MAGLQFRKQKPYVAPEKSVDKKTTDTTPVVTDSGKTTSTYPSGAAQDSRARRALRNSQFQAQKLSGLGDLQRRDYTQVYRPGLRRVSDTAEMPIQSLVDRASRDVELGFDKSRGIMNRNASRMGINPNSGRFQGLQQQWGLARAAAEAGAMTRARRTGREDNFRRLMDAVGMASGAAGGARGSYGGASGIQAGAFDRYNRLGTEEGAYGGFMEGGGNRSDSRGSSSFQNEINSEFEADKGGGLGSKPVVTRQPYRRVPNTLERSPYEGAPSGPPEGW